MSFSVIIPAYNRATLLPFTLDAVLAQGKPPAEVIVVDDGSADATAEVADRYAPRVRRITIENSGDLVARNTGLRAATQPRVAFCDSDDLWRPGFLAAMDALWQAEPGVRVAYCDFLTVQGDTWGTESKFAAAPAGFWDGLRPVSPQAAVFDAPIVERLLHFQPFFPSAMAADRAYLLGLGGWDTSVGRTLGSDFATALLVAGHPPLGILRQPLVGIRKHAGNFSRDVQAMNLGDAFILEHLLATRPSLAPLAHAIRASVEKRRREALDTAFARHDFPAVREIAAKLPRRSAAIRLKHIIAALPEPLRGALAAVALGMGDRKARALPWTRKGA
jgi:glycosyltransferase involved in cell wall biosynthesis